MSDAANSTRATVIPCLRYRDAPKAIEWLCTVFDFERQLVVPNEDGTIAHVPTRYINAQRPQAQASQLKSKTRTTAAAVLVAGIWKAVCGTSALMIRGENL